MDVAKFLSVVVTRQGDPVFQYQDMLMQGKIKESLKFADRIIRSEAKWASQMVEREKVVLISDENLHKRIDKLGKVNNESRELLMKYLRCIGESRSREAAVGAIGYLAEVTRLLRRQAMDMMYREADKARAWEITESLVNGSLKFAVVIHFAGGGSHVPTSFSSRVMLLGIETWAEMMIAHALDCYSDEACPHAKKITRILRVYPA